MLRLHFKRIFNRTLDVLYPPRCIACSMPGAWWCDACQQSVDRLSEDPCPKCLLVQSNEHHLSCNHSFQFSGVVTTGYYHSKPLRKLITELKYRGVTATSQDVENYLRFTCHRQERPFPWMHESEISLQPMPLSLERERDRGFNQASWLAERFQRTWLPDVPIVNVLGRLSGTVNQASLEDRSMRRVNVQGEFVTTNVFKGSVILVDDVVTTGSTANDAARALIRSGAHTVYLLTLAIGK